MAGGGAGRVLRGGSAAPLPTSSGSPRKPVRTSPRWRRPHRRPRAVPGFRPGGPGPLYWSTYDYENVSNTIIPEAVWKANIDWVADTFRDDGYTMVCTDGWIDGTQKITPHGYIVSQADDWEHEWAWWANYLKAKGMQLGVYYNPLWATKSAVTNPSVTVVGRPDVKVGDIVNVNDYFDGGGQLQWVDTNRDGAEEYVKGYVAYFRGARAVFLRIDFLAYYETGFDQNDGTVGVDHGRASDPQALQWIWEAAEGMQISLGDMPNLFDHGAGNGNSRDCIRIGNDASFGTWFNLSGGRDTWQPEWSQWNNPFLGFTGFADISGRGQMIPDGDPLIMSSFTRDEERQSAINLFTLAGAAIAITDQVDTIGDTPTSFRTKRCWPCARPGWSASRSSTTPTPSNTTSRAGTPSAGSASCPTGAGPSPCSTAPTAPPKSPSQSTSPDVLGFTGPAAVRDLWAHQDLGPMTSYQTSSGRTPRCSSGRPARRRPFPGRGGRLGGFGPVRVHLRRSRREGLRHRPRHRGEQRGGGRFGAQSRQPTSRLPCGQRHREPIDPDRARAGPRHRPGSRLGDP